MYHIQRPWLRISLKNWRGCFHDDRRKGTSKTCISSQRCSCSHGCSVIWKMVLIVVSAPSVSCWSGAWQCLESPGRGTVQQHMQDDAGRSTRHATPTLRSCSSWCWHHEDQPKGVGYQDVSSMVDHSLSVDKGWHLQKISHTLHAEDCNQRSLQPSGCFLQFNYDGFPSK